MNYNVYVLGFYLLILVIIAAIANKYSKTHEGYLLGNRRLSPFTAAIGAGAADMSGWMLLGLPGAVYVFGMNQIWIVVGLIIGAFCNWTFVAERLREKSQSLDVLTIPDFVSKISASKGSSIRIVSSVMILIFFTMYVASGFVSGAKVFGDYFDIGYRAGLLLTFAAVVLTTLIGGFLAVSWSEVFQGMIMVIVIALIPVLAIVNVNTLDANFTDLILSKNENMLNIFYNTSFVGILSLLAWGLGYFGQPHILSKFMALKDMGLAKKSRNIAMSWMIIGLFFAVLTGFFGAAFFAKETLSDPELVLLALSNLLLHPWFIAIVIIAILSAVFSTANAQLLVVSSVFTNDLKLVKKTVTMNRIMVFLVGILALMLSLDPNSKVLSMVGYAWAGFGASFGPIVLLSLNSRYKITEKAALFGILSGGLSVIGWNMLQKMMPDVSIFQLYELLPAFLISCMVILVINGVISKKPS